MWQDCGVSQLLLVAAVLVVAWLALLAVKLGLGYTLKMIAHAYLLHYEENQSRIRSEPSPRPEAWYCSE